MQKERTLKRTYQAIVHGEVAPEQGTVDAPIGLREDSIITREVRPDGQRSVTHFKVLARGGGISWLELTLETGRTHQIRVHMSHLGHPLLGDDMYGGNRELIARQALHAVKLSFVHPRDKRPMELLEPLPPDMEELVARFFR
jgi:23S rRNA pseudouridine1911/1915/1917 synthase